MDTCFQVPYNDQPNSCMKVTMELITVEGFGQISMEGGIIVYIYY